MPKSATSRTGLAPLVWGALFALAAGLAGSQPELTVAGHAFRPGEGPSAGGAFALSAEAVSPVSPARDGGAPVRARALVLSRSADGSLCFCGGSLFSDGFESGNAGAWSAATP